MMDLFKGNNIFLLVLSIICVSLATDELNIGDPRLYLVKVTEPDAVCLDGSPAAYYISKEGDPKKIYL